ncbi:MAG TPA: HDIG domain-containing protein, partial [Sphaerochaeta sp.]|nr:HDIG domain-containing protein [Sphaerochaeta sp.]
MRKSSHQHTASSRYHLFIIVVLMVLVTGCAFFIPLLPHIASASQQFTYQVGQLAEEDIFAPRDFVYIDDEQTEALRLAAERAILPIASLNLRQTSLSYSRMDIFSKLLLSDTDQRESNLYSFLGRENLIDRRNLLQRLFLLNEEELTYYIATVNETASMVLSRGLMDNKSYERILGDGYDSFRLETGVHPQGDGRNSLDELLTKENLDDLLFAYLRGYIRQQSSFQPQLIIDTLVLLLENNLIYDEAKTVTLRAQARAKVEEVQIVIPKNTKLVSKDTPLTVNQVKMLETMNAYSFLYTPTQLLARAIFTIMVTLVGCRTFLLFAQGHFRSNLYLILALSALLVSILLIGLIGWLLPATVLDSHLPVLLAPMFILQITDKKRLAFLTSLMISSYVALLPTSSMMTFFFSIATGSLVLWTFQSAQRRLDTLSNWAYGAITTSFAALVANMLVGLDSHLYLPLVFGMIINVTVSMILVDVTVPIFERLLNIPTSYRLLEISREDNPLLERMAQVAQGSFTHSRHVAELAYVAAKTVGANPLLARVGAMFHDIGKSDHPEYYIENQSEENKHDDIKPSLSVAIIKSHVKLGVEKGREAGLPQEVLDIIGQHHGNDVIQFFYSEAIKEAQARSGEVNIEDYSYNNEIPQTKEAAVV